MRLWRKSTTNILAISLVVIAIAAAVAVVLANYQQKTEVHLGDGTFHLKVASNQAAREAGLSGVKELKPDEGLLMVFDSDSKWGIWMKGMKIPIDIIWLDSSNEVVDIFKDAKPELGARVLEPKVPARYVIELSAGSVKQNGIKLGDRAAFKLEEAQ